MKTLAIGNCRLSIEFGVQAARAIGRQLAIENRQLEMTLCL